MNSRLMVLSVFIGKRRSFQWKCGHCCRLRRIRCRRRRLFLFVASGMSLLLFNPRIYNAKCVCMCLPYDCDAPNVCIWFRREQTIMESMFACVIRCEIFQVNKSEADQSAVTCTRCRRFRRRRHLHSIKFQWISHFVYVFYF